MLANEMVGNKTCTDLAESSRRRENGEQAQQQA